MQAPYPFETIRLEYITFSDHFIRSLHETVPDPATIANLAQFGQTVPLLVWQRTETLYQLLSGYPQFMAIASLGLTRVACQTLPRLAPPLVRYSLQILHDRSSAQASPILHAHLLQQAKQELTDTDIFSLMVLMGYKRQRRTLDELIALLHLSPSTVTALHHGKMTPKAGKLMQFLSHDEQELVSQLIGRYRVGGSKQHKLIEMTTELRLRNNTSVRDLLREWMDILQGDVQENAPQRFNELLHMLEALYHPEKTKMESDFHQILKELALPDSITIVPSPSFEDESLEMRIRFDDVETFQGKWKTMKMLFQQ